jgi:proteasome accessory factor B
MPTSKPPLRRLFWALGRLRQGKQLRATDLAGEFEVTTRTAYRDIDFLRDEWRVPMEFDRARGTYALTEPIAALPTSITLSQGELVSLYFAEKVLKQYRGTPFEADLESAFRKIQDLLPHEVQVSPEAIDGYLSLDPGHLHAPDAEVFRAVLKAQQARRKVRVRYRSLNSAKTTTRTIHPYHVANHRGDWYVAAWDEGRSDVRLFALHRMLAAEELEAPYEIPASFSYKAFMQGAFGVMRGGEPTDVAIRFGPRQALWIREGSWRKPARVVEQSDGGLVLHLRVTETSGVRRWVMQFGGEAEVLSPPSVRRAVAAELEQALRAYRKRAGLARQREVESQHSRGTHA